MELYFEMANVMKNVEEKNWKSLFSCNAMLTLEQALEDFFLFLFFFSRIVMRVSDFLQVETFELLNG